jgi:hypothetical protein
LTAKDTTVQNFVQYWQPVLEYYTDYTMHLPSEGAGTKGDSSNFTRHSRDDPENRVFAGDVKDIFRYKNFQQINKLEKSSTRSDFWNEDRTDTLT